MRLLSLTVMATLSLAALTFPAQAQQGDDWDLREDADRKLTLATLEFEGAPGLGVRCLDGALAVLVTGAGPTPEGGRFSMWTAGRSVRLWRDLPEGGGLYNAAPLIAARDLMRGGDIVIDVPVANAPTKRYRLAGPVDSAAVRRVLEACDRPTIDSRDDLRRLEPAEIKWEKRVAPDFPEAAASNGVRAGEVIMSCIIGAAGAFEDCRVESETPAGNGFGQSALRAYRQARIAAQPGGADIAGSLSIFSVRYQLQ